jgi:hypothetical protein
MLTARESSPDRALFPPFPPKTVPTNSTKMRRVPRKRVEYDQLYTVDDRRPLRTSSTSLDPLQFATAAARYRAQFPSSSAHDAPMGASLRLDTAPRDAPFTASATKSKVVEEVDLTQLDWLDGSDASNRLLKSALDIARPHIRRAPLVLASVRNAASEDPAPNPLLDSIVHAVSTLEAAIHSSSDMPFSPVLQRGRMPSAGSVRESGYAEKESGSANVVSEQPPAPRAGAVSEAALRLTSPRRPRRRLEDTIAQSLEYLAALEACLPVPEAGALAPTQPGAQGSSAAALAVRAEASTLVDRDVAYLPTLLAQAGVTMDGAMAAGVRHRGLVCQEEAELLAALWSAASSAVGPILQRYVSVYDITRVDLELLRAAVSERRTRALQDAEHLVVTTTALDVRCLRLRNGLARIPPGSGQLTPEVRSRCNAVIEWATALLVHARALLADAAKGDEEVAGVVGAAGSIRLDVTATWAPLRNMGREASERAQKAARSNDAIGAGVSRLSLILEDEAAAGNGEGPPTESSELHHHHHHHGHHHGHHHRRRHRRDSAVDERDELDLVDAALGADIDSHVRVSSAGSSREGSAAARSMQQRARGAVTRAVFAALAASEERVDVGETGFSDDDDAGELPAATALVRKFSARFAARSAQQVRDATVLLTGRDSGSAAVLPVQLAGAGGSRQPLAVAAMLPSSRSGWWGDEPLVSQRTTELYQQVMRDAASGGGAARRGVAPSSPSAIAMAQKRKAEAEAVAAAESALAAAQAAAVERSSHLQPTRSAMRFVPAGTARNDSALAAALSTRHLKGGGVSFVPGAVDTSDPRTARHKPPSYSARFESPEVRDARELAESVAGMAYARQARRKFRVAGVRARREVRQAALDSFSDAVSSASADALLALVASLRSASEDLSRESERLQADLGRTHHAAQAGASVTHAVWEARAEARRMLIQRHLGSPSGSRFTRHISISRAPLAHDVGAPLPASSPSSLEEEEEGRHNGASHEGAGDVVAVPSEHQSQASSSPLCAAPLTLGRRSSLPLHAELSRLSVSPSFVVLVEQLKAERRAALQALQPPPPRPPSIEVPLLSEAAVDQIIASDSARDAPEEHLHRNSPSPKPRLPHSQQKPSSSGGARSPTGANVESGSISPQAEDRDVEASGTAPLLHPKGIQPHAKPTPRNDALSSSNAAVGAGGTQAPHVPRLTEDGEVAAWNQRPTTTATLRAGSARPSSGRPPSANMFGMAAVVSRVMSKDSFEGSRSDKKKQAEARVARSRASLASVLRVRPMWACYRHLSLVVNTRHLCFFSVCRASLRSPMLHRVRLVPDRKPRRIL